MKQEIILPGVRNARELGGYPAAGKTIRKGVFIRSGALKQISEEGIERLQKVYRLQTVVDFRMSMEREKLPDPVIPDCESIPLPVIEVEDYPVEKYSKEFPELIKMLSDPKTDRMAISQKVIETGLVDDRMYVGFLMGDRGMRAFRAFFQAVLSLEEGRALLWHCSDGKDRAGCAAMLLLYALGASEETVYQDYLLTNEYNEDVLEAYLLTNEYNEDVLEAARKKVEAIHLPPDKLDLFLILSGCVSRLYLENAQKAMTEHFGSVEGYLSGALGIGETERDLLRSRFLE